MTSAEEPRQPKYRAYSDVRVVIATGRGDRTRRPLPPSVRRSEFDDLVPRPKPKAKPEDQPQEKPADPPAGA